MSESASVKAGCRVRLIPVWARRSWHPKRVGTVMSECYEGRAWSVLWDGRRTVAPIAKPYLELADAPPAAEQT